MKNININVTQKQPVNTVAEMNSELMEYLGIPDEIGGNPVAGFVVKISPNAIPVAEITVALMCLEEKSMARKKSESGADK